MRAPFLDAALQRAKVCVGIDARIASLQFLQGVSSSPSGIVGEPLLDVAPDRRERVRPRAVCPWPERHARLWPGPIAAAVSGDGLGTGVLGCRVGRGTGIDVEPDLGGKVNVNGARHGGPPERVLQVFDLPEQTNGVKRLEDCRVSGLHGTVEHADRDQPLEWRPRTVIGSVNPAVRVVLDAQFERWLEEVHRQPCRAIYLRELSVGQISFESVIADQSADDRTVLLFNIALVILLVASPRVNVIASRAQ